MMGAAVAMRAAGSVDSASSEGAARSQLQKAELKLFDPKVGGKTGKDALGLRSGSLAFQFNPKELSLTKSAKWERSTARGARTAGPTEFAGADPSKLSVEMFFDATEEQNDSVVTAVEKLLSCCVPTEETRGQKRALPPLVVFQWGPVIGFPGFITQVGVKYTLFASDGMPLRATCSVSIEELAGELKAQNPTSGTLSVHRHHTVVEGDSLASLAHREYGDPTLWRALASFNDVDDPMRLRAGTALLVPTLDDLLRV